jgi:hypothetical protein
MKRLAYASVAFLLLAPSLASFSADPSSRPAGVTAEEWVAINDRLGIVLVQPPAKGGDPVPMPVPSTALLLPLKPAVGGYFMVKGSKGWIRLVVVEPVKGPADAG